jgi:predicted nucleic acid-binding protein
MFVLRLQACSCLAVISNYVVDETVTWLRMRAGYEAAVAFRDIIRESEKNSRLHTVWVTESVEERAWKLFRKHPGRKLSLTDCTSAVLAADLKLPVWSYDSDFVALGFRAWPGSE